MVTFFFIPESANYLLSKGRREDAFASLQFIRGTNREGVEKELAVIQLSIDEAQKDKASFLDIFRVKGNLRALIICVGLMFFQQACGINVVLFNSQSIFDKTDSDLKPEIATICIGVVQIIASMATPLIVDRLGRKIILLFSAAGMAITTVRETLEKMYIVYENKA